MNREVHVRFWERPEVKALRANSSADRDPRTTSGHDNHGADEKVSRDWGKQPGTLHAMSSTYNLSLQDAA